MVSPIQTSTLTPILNLDSFIYSLSAAEPIVAAVADAQTAPAAKIVQVTKTAPVEVKAFTRNLTIGSKGDDVKALQIFLNTHGFSVAQSGVGSPGHETALFGSATQKALSRFQIAQNIKPAVGFFGPATRARVNEMNGL